jgi:GNAT superfamily N-acetyltransferase
MRDNEQALRLERVIDKLPEGFDALRAEALADGHVFVERLADDWNSCAMRFDREGETLLAAYANAELAAIAGLTLEPLVAGALRMRRFYVRPSYRRRGIGHKLATQLLVQARSTGKPVTVNAAPASFSFWESLGFVRDRHGGHTHILTADAQRARPYSS